MIFGREILCLFVCLAYSLTLISSSGVGCFSYFFYKKNYYFIFLLICLVVVIVKLIINTNSYVKFKANYCKFLFKKNKSSKILCVKVLIKLAFLSNK